MYYYYVFLICTLVLALGIWLVRVRFSNTKSKLSNEFMKFMQNPTVKYLFYLIIFLILLYFLRALSGSFWLPQNVEVVVPDNSVNVEASTQLAIHNCQDFLKSVNALKIECESLESQNLKFTSNICEKFLRLFQDMAANCEYVVEFSKKSK